MPSPTRPSPRAAIKEWLEHTRESSPAKDKLKTKPRDESHAEGNEGKRSTKRPQRESGEPRRRAEKPRQRSHRPDVPESEDSRIRDTAREPKNDRNLADQLGLHAPFRSFATRGNDVVSEVRPDRERRKRRRNSSSSSLHPGPAAFFEETVRHPSVHEDARNRRNGQEQHGSVDASISPSVTVASPNKPAKTYEKRPRHKTREDRYELKETKKRSRAKNGEKGKENKSKKSRRRKEKTGAALMHDFSANNIESERLTLKAPVPLGFFGKGRASSPVRRRGLPDLTFSEMSFLNHGKPKPKEVPTNSQRSARKRDKAADSEAEISRFFASSKDQSHGDGVTMSNKDRGNLDNVTVERGRQQGGSSISPVDLPGKPFLGFGSCGPGHVSSLVPDNDVDQLSPLDQPLSSRSTTYFTWSQTNPSRHASSRHRTRSGRLSSETRLQLTPGLESTAGGRQRILSADVERNFGDESRARSSAYHPEIEHRGRGCDPAGPVSRPDRPFKASTERQQSRDDQKDHSKRQHKANEMSHPDSGLALQLSSPKPTLASLLATQIRPELLGEVLDALLARITNNGVRKDRDSRPSDTPHSKGLEGESVSEGIPKTQTQHDLNHPNAPNGPPFDWNVPNKPEVAERTYQACGSCCSQPLDRPSLRPSAQVASKASGLEPPIRDTDERLAASNARGTQGHSTDTQLNTQAATVRPGCSNAWTGYSSLYQGQMGPVNKRRQSCKDSLQDHALEDRQDKSYFFQTPAEAQDHDSASDGGGYDMFEENHRSDPHLDRRYLDAEDANRWNGTDLQIYDRMDPMHQQPQSKISENQDESYDRGCLIARNADLEAVTDVAPDQDLDDRVETLHGQDRPNFLGSRMLTMLDRNGSHSSWSHGSHQSSRRAPSARGGGVDTDMVGEASLSGFWKPNRLY